MARSDRFTIKSKTPQLYADFTSDFEVNLSTKDLIIITNEDAIKESLKNLILTLPGEKFYTPLYGCKVNALLFEPMNNITSSLLKNEIIQAVRSFDPRIITLEVSVDENFDDNEYHISLFYTIINIPTQQELQLILSRVR